MAMAMSEEEIKKVTVNLPKPLWRRVRVAAAAQDKTVTDLVREWLTDRLAQEHGPENHTSYRPSP